MRRFLCSVAVSVAVVAIAPAGALAGQPHKRHHSRTHHARTSTVRHRRFGRLAASSTTTSPTTTTTPSAPAGTVASFSGGVLTITLAGGTTTVSGMVTNATEIECRSADSMASTTSHDDGDGGNPGSGSGEDQHGSSGGGDHGSGGDENNAGNGGDDQRDANQSCSIADLVQNAMVAGAELKISSAGAVWDKIELVK